VTDTAVKRYAVGVALGVQVLSLGLAVLCGVTGVSVAISGCLTIIILLDSLLVGSKRNSSIEELVEVRVSERTNILVAQMSKYEQQASTDVMTGLLNRRGAESAIADNVSRSINLGASLSFLLIDIDHFKSINDSFGHTVGDEVITAVANCIKNNIRNSDSAIRWGGEEYLVLLPDTDLLGAVHAAEKLREQIALLTVQKVTTSVSIGCAELGHDDFMVVLARADMNLYFAKSKGRNRVFPDFFQNMLDR
jgi:diguanylate cyclase (GGDEF)-like protein